MGIFAFLVTLKIMTFGTFVYAWMYRFDSKLWMTPHSEWLHTIIKMFTTISTALYVVLMFSLFKRYKQSSD